MRRTALVSRRWRSYFKARVEGIEISAIIARMPTHVRPSVLMNVHSELLTACAFLQARANSPHTARAAPHDLRLATAYD
jgi:hypothetical protein